MDRSWRPHGSRTVLYSTAATEAVKAFVAERYALTPLNCTFLQRGFNDAYLIEAAGGERFVFRLSVHRDRGPPDVANETAFLAYLETAGVPVAAAVPNRDGVLHDAMALPDGMRAAVLFRHAGGRRPGPDDAGDARAQGVTLARLHLAAPGFPGAESGRYRLDLDHLLHRPMAAVQALGDGPPEVLAGLAAVAGRLACAVTRRPGLTLLRCHGDCHGLNASIATAGQRAGQAVFFDFDEGGFGYLAYDLAVHLWAQVAFNRGRTALWRAFQAGYVSVRRLEKADEAAIPFFVALRHIWLLGEFAAHTAAWGREVVSPGWLSRELAFLLAWERDRLGPQLV